MEIDKLGFLNYVIDQQLSSVDMEAKYRTNLRQAKEAVNELQKEESASEYISIDQTHETGVMAMKDGKVIYFRSFHYPTQKDEAQAAFKYAESLGGGWYMFHLGNRWSIANEEESFRFNIPMP